jgi:Cu(I)/Ag(I) efflux system membrane fusion protein
VDRPDASVPGAVGESPAAVTGPAGLAVVAIDAERQQLIGLKTAPVTSGSVGAQWRTVGRVEVDPTRVRITNVKVEGYVERVYVDFVGRQVRRGEPLFSLYSPALLTAQSELILALKTRKLLAEGGALAGNGDDLVAAARRKLELWDVPRSEIDRVERTGEPTRALTFYSPISGVVTAKKLVEGTRLMPGDAPYEITDLAMVWVMADAYEQDLERVRLGSAATFSLAAYPGRTFVGEVTFIDPMLDPATRTAKVHLHFPNGGAELKPGMFGEVVLSVSAREGLRVPADAVVRAGTRDVVFLALGGGRFAPREVTLGGHTEDHQVEVLGGLDAGQEVVTRANFLVDSESQLRSSLAALGKR